MTLPRNLDTAPCLGYEIMVGERGPRTGTVFASPQAKNRQNGHEGGGRSDDVSRCRPRPKAAFPCLHADTHGHAQAVTGLCRMIAYYAQTALPQLGNVHGRVQPRLCFFLSLLLGRARFFRRANHAPAKVKWRNRNFARGLDNGWNREEGLVLFWITHVIQMILALRDGK